MNAPNTNVEPNDKTAPLSICAGTDQTVQANPMMTNELEAENIKKEPADFGQVNSVLPSDREYALLKDMSMTVANSHMPLPKDAKTANAVLTKFLIGRELGLGPMTALHNISIIEGRAALPALVKVAIVRKRGLGDVEVIEADEQKATVRVTYGDNKTAQVVWTIKDAERAELLNKSNWRHYPRSMLVARATDEACKRYFQDIFLGCPYSPDELGQETDQDGRPIMDYAISDDAKSTLPWKPATEMAEPAMPSALEPAGALPVGDLDDKPGEPVSSSAQAAGLAPGPKDEPSKPQPAAQPKEKSLSVSLETVAKRVIQLRVPETSWRYQLMRYGVSKFSELKLVDQAHMVGWLDSLRQIRMVQDGHRITDKALSLMLAERGVTDVTELTGDMIHEFRDVLLDQLTPFDREELGLTGKEGSIAEKK